MVLLKFLRAQVMEIFFSERPGGASAVGVGGVNPWRSFYLDRGLTQIFACAGFGGWGIPQSELVAGGALLTYLTWWPAAHCRPARPGGRRRGRRPFTP